MENNQKERIAFVEKHPHLFDEYDEREKKHKDIFISNKSALRKSYMSKLQEIGLAQIAKEGTPIYAPWITRKYGNKNVIESVMDGNLRITALGSLLLHNIDLIEREAITTF